MPNRLHDEESLYLRQHAENPVDWWPWGPEALAEAARRDVPLLVSIGYSSCHWCHVMAHESFESAYIAGLMNEHFVCVKVDREERPDVDRHFMEAVQMMNGGQGGWPLNVFCLPDGRPFAGGTYFPPEDRGQGLVPWPQLLLRVSDFYQRRRDQLIENAEAILQNLAATDDPARMAGTAATEGFAPGDLLTAAEELCENHDDETGGFGTQPKFPPAMALAFLLELRGAASVEEGRPSLRRRIDTVVGTTAQAMARGGLYDQVGGGFARYCVDAQWTIPHFEKMLYDNGLLLDFYARALRASGEEIFQAVLEETLGWLEREMAAGPLPGYAASLDADSEGGEGSYYVWTPAQVEEVLGAEEGRRFCEAYGITEEGNFEEGKSQPTLRTASDEDRASFAEARAKLLAARARRPAPPRDDKRLTAWNALALRGMAEAAFALGDKAVLARALAQADALWEALHRGEGRLHAVLYESGPRITGTLDDHALLAEACLALSAYAEWVEEGAAARFEERAVLLAEAIERDFADSEGPGFFLTAVGGDALLQRGKVFFDNATPAAHSSLLHVFSQLYQLTGEARWQAAFGDLREAVAGLLRRAPAALPHALAACTAEAKGLAVLTVPRGQDLDKLQRALAARPFRRVFLRRAGEGESPEGYRLCVGTQCLPPVPSAAEVAGKL